MSSTKESLREVADKFHERIREDQISAAGLTREEVFKRATWLLEEAAQGGLYKTIVYVAGSSEMDLAGCECSLLDDSRETVEEAIQRMKGLGPDKLRGIAGELRDYLATEGLNLSLRIRIEGHGCKNARYVWDVIASW